MWYRDWNNSISRRWPIVSAIQSYIPKPSSLGSVSTIQGALSRDNVDLVKQMAILSDAWKQKKSTMAGLYLFMTKLNVPCAARLRRVSLASTAIPSGCKKRLNWHLTQWSGNTNATYSIVLEMVPLLETRHQALCFLQELQAQMRL